MAITFNWAREMMGGKWQVNVTDNDGQTHLLKFNAGAQPTAQQVRNVVLAVEGHRAERDVLELAERQRLQLLRSRVIDFRQGNLTAPEQRALLVDVIEELQTQLRA